MSTNNITNQNYITDYLNNNFNNINANYIIIPELVMLQFTEYVF